jgi:hypothetical protein
MMDGRRFGKGVVGRLRRRYVRGEGGRGRIVRVL